MLGDLGGGGCALGLRFMHFRAFSENEERLCIEIRAEHGCGRGRRPEQSVDKALVGRVGLGEASEGATGLAFSSG